VSLHVEVEGDMTLREAHSLETDVMQSIGELPEVDDVFVHVDPKEIGEWKDDGDEELVATENDDADAYDDRRRHHDRESSRPTGRG